MQAHPGDWLIMHSHTDGGHVRRAEIISTGADGAPNPVMVNSNGPAMARLA
jgi:hypothetical protein